MAAGDTHRASLTQQIPIKRRPRVARGRAADQRHVPRRPDPEEHEI